MEELAQPGKKRRWTGISQSRALLQDNTHQHISCAARAESKHTHSLTPREERENEQLGAETGRLTKSDQEPRNGQLREGRTNRLTERGSSSQAETDRSTAVSPVLECLPLTIECDELLDESTDAEEGARTGEQDERDGALTHPDSEAHAASAGTQLKATREDQIRH